MKQPLSRVYLDDQPIPLLEDEVRPTLARIVLASGKNPGRVAVVALPSRFGERGEPLDVYDVIDRAAEPTRPIYLRCLPKHAGAIEAPLPGGPTTMPAKAAPPTTPTASPVPATRHRDPVIDQLGGPLPPRDATLQPRRAPSLAQAEAEAEQHQEEQRDQQDTLQDEAEAVQDSNEDRDLQA